MRFYWFKTARAANLNITRDLFKKKALQLSQAFNNHNFHASNGWLENFKEQHVITRRAISSEGANVNGNSVEVWENTILTLILNQFETKDIFDETRIRKKKRYQSTL